MCCSFCLKHELDITYLSCFMEIDLGKIKCFGSNSYCNKRLVSSCFIFVSCKLTISQSITEFWGENTNLDETWKISMEKNSPEFHVILKNHKGEQGTIYFLALLIAYIRKLCLLKIPCLLKNGRGTEIKICQVLKHFQE